MKKYDNDDQNHQMTSFWALLNVPDRNFLSSTASEILHLCNDDDDQTDDGDEHHY